MRKTCPKEEYLEIGEDILDLSSRILSKNQIEEAENLSIMLTQSKKKREQAIRKILSILPIRPKRPLYYCHHELKYLPRYTRDSMRYLGDYIDFLVKRKAYDITKNSNNLSMSLGSNIKYLKREFDDEFIEILRTFNQIYVNAKHKWDVGERRHLFTPKEVVHSVFIAAIIGEKLKESSEFVKNCAEDKITDINTTTS